MSGDGEEIEQQHGLDVSMDEAKRRFRDATMDELAGIASPPSKIADGELELVPFKKDAIRRVCHNDEWWYSVVDVVAALTGSDRARKYWSDLKSKMEREGYVEVSDEIGQLAMPSPDGKSRQTDVATAETVLRIIQSISSPRAEPFKRWLAKVGYERIQEAQDPEVLIKRAIMHYTVQGRSDDWIEKRIRGIMARKELTAEWKKRGIEEGKQYAMLTNTISERTFGVGTERHKRIKGLSSQNLRDHMTDLELILTMLGETSTKQIAEQRNAQGLWPNYEAAKDGGDIAGGARKQIEQKTGKPVVSTTNFLGKSAPDNPKLLR